MMIILMAAMLLPEQPEKTNSFCERSEFVAIENLIKNKAAYLGRRIKTRGIVRTDGKEYSIITKDDNIKYAILMSSDRISEVYASSHSLYMSHYVNYIDDFFAKLHQLKGMRAPRKFDRIMDYRQKLLVCGRIIKQNGIFKLSIDDSIREGSYILP